MTDRRALALDTNILILAVEGADGDPDVVVCRKLVFDLPQDASFIVSEIVLSEILVRPMRQENVELVRFYRRLLTDLRAFRLVQVTRSILLEAARLRSISSLKLADAIHLATATRIGCRGLVTLDAALKAPGALSVLSPSDALAIER
jgi:predicted nucleic acid-binding protein